MANRSDQRLELRQRSYFERQMIVVTEDAVIRALDQATPEPTEQKSRKDKILLEVSLGPGLGLGLEIPLLDVVMGVADLTAAALKAWRRASESGLHILPVGRSQALELTFPPAIGVAPVLWGGADGCVRHSATATQVSSNRTHSRLGGGRRPRGPWGAKGDRQVDALGAPLGARGLAWAGEAMLRFFGGNHPSRRTTVHADAASAATAVSAVCGKCASGVHSRNPEYPHGVDGAAFPQVAEEVRVAAAACVADDEGSLFCLARLARPSPCPECSRLKSFSRSGIACTGTRRRVRRTTVTGPGGGRCGSPGRGLRGRARPGHG